MRAERSGKGGRGILIRRIARVSLDVLMYVFIAICIIAVLITLLGKRSSDGAVDIFGMQMRRVISESMERDEGTDVSSFRIKDIPLDSMVFIETVPEDAAAAAEWYADLVVGDVLTFKYVYTRQITITHRIVGITEKDGGGYLIELQGDNRSADAQTLRQTIDTSADEGANYIIGKVIGQSYPLGLLISAVEKPIGIALIVIVPCVIIIILEIIKLLGYFGEAGKKRAEAEKAERENEIEELRRKIEELEKENAKMAAESQTEAAGAEDKSCDIIDEESDMKGG